MSIKERKKIILHSLQNLSSLRLCKIINLRKPKHKGTLRSNYWVCGRQIFGRPISQQNMAVQISIWLLNWTERCSADPNKTWRVLTASRIKSQYFPWKSWEPQINWPGTVTSSIAMWRELPSLVTSLETFHGWRGNLVQLFKETLFVAMQTKAASQYRGPGGDIQDYLLEQRACRFIPTLYLHSLLHY